MAVAVPDPSATYIVAPALGSAPGAAERTSRRSGIPSGGDYDLARVGACTDGVAGISLEPEVQDSQEQQWTLAAQGGDTEAFRRIVMMLEQRVAATVIGMVGPGPEAEDIGQETFMRLYRALPKFRGDSSLASYATRIAINLCKDERLNRKKRAAVFTKSDDAVAAQAPDPASETDHLEQRDLVDKALLQLSEEYREVVVLRLLDGFSTRETAKILDVPEGTVTSRLARAQMKLRAILAPMLEGPA